MKFGILQGLRGAAATLVVGYHAMGEALRAYPEATSPLFSVFAAGGIGVDLFFVISGFIIAMTADGAAGVAAGLAYLRKRIIRIVPTYWAFTLLLMASTLTAFPLISSEVPLTPEWISASLLFLPPALAERLTPILFIGWTLNYEMLFYALVFVAILLGRASLAPVLILALVATGLVAPADETAIWYTFVTNPIMIEFVLGYAVFAIYKTQRIGRSAAVAIMAIGALAFLASYWVVPEVPGLMRPLVNGPLLAVLILGVICFEASSPGLVMPGWIVKSGDASYSIYLVQAATLPIGNALLIGSGLAALGPDAMALMITALTVAAGVLAYHYVERPLMALVAATIPSPAVRAPTRTLG